MELAQRVLPDSPECQAMDLEGCLEIDLEMFNEGGGRPENAFRMSVLRPAARLADRGIGDVVSVVMDELGFRGTGRIVRIAKSPLKCWVVCGSSPLARYPVANSHQ